MTTTPSTSGSTLVPGAPAAQPAKPVRTPKPADKHGWWWGTGRRKTAVARARMKPSKGDAGKVIVERPGKEPRTVEQYFPEERDRTDVLSPLKLTSTEGRFDVVLKLHGGGLMGQAQASRLAIARALQAYDPAMDAALRDAGMLTRDSREVERKKYGQAGARRRFQFSKR